MPGCQSDAGWDLRPARATVVCDEQHHVAIHTPNRKPKEIPQKFKKKQCWLLFPSWMHSPAEDPYITTGTPGPSCLTSAMGSGRARVHPVRTETSGQRSVWGPHGSCTRSLSHPDDFRFTLWVSWAQPARKVVVIVGIGMWPV